MPWLKRNLFLVIGGVVALGLLGFAIFFLITKIKEESQVKETLTQQTEVLKGLVNRDPYPNGENIEAVKTDQKKLQQFLAETQKLFPAAPIPQPLTTRELRALLDNTINDLKSEAEKAGVTIPDQYWFTFASQKSKVEFPAGSLEPLATQLVEIKAICEVLFSAKINSLIGMKRVPIADEANTGSQDFLGSKIVTNEWAVVTPYEITFQGFSGELAAVLEGLGKHTQAFLVRNTVVERGTAQEDPSQLQTQVMPYMTYPGTSPSMIPNDALQRRYGGSRYGPRTMLPQPAAPVIAPRPVARTTVVLDEKPLKFILSIEVV
ncbi:MAG: hypothetical protein AB1813_18815, partial [Verrucomicrobiota bacterium]